MIRQFLNTLLFFSIAPLVFSQNINTEENFPDPIFRSFIENYMAITPGGSFTAVEAAAKDEAMDCGGKGIESLKGIEYFTGLRSLTCWSNRLQELDVSKNINLRELYCAQQYFENGKDTSIVSLDLTQNKQLQKLNCSQLTLSRLDLPENGALVELSCGGNGPLKELNVSGHPMLELLDCWSTALQELDLSKNPRLKFLACHTGPIQRLNLDNCYDLEDFRCSSLLLQELDLSNRKKLHTIYGLSLPELKSFDLSGCTGLVKLSVSNTQLTHLNLSNLTALTEVHISYNANLRDIVNSCG